jgi:hypothetical protein
MKARKPAAKALRPPHPQPPHPLEAQLLLYREALRRVEAHARDSRTAESPIDDEMVSES